MKKSNSKMTSENVSKKVDVLNKAVTNLVKAVDKLAESTAHGFSEVGSKLKNLEEKVATKKEVKEITDRLDRIEFHMNTHERRIEILEDKMRMVSVKIGLRK